MELKGKKFLNIIGTAAIIFFILTVVFLTSGISLLTKLSIICLSIIVMAKWHKKQISTKWGVAILGTLLLSVALLIPYLNYTQTIQSDAMTTVGVGGGRVRCALERGTPVATVGGWCNNRYGTNTSPSSLYNSCVKNCSKCGYLSCPSSRSSSGGWRGFFR